MRTLPRINSLDSDDDGSVDTYPSPEGISHQHAMSPNRHTQTSQGSSSTTSASSHDGRPLQHANGQLHPDVAHAAPANEQHSADPPAPSFASRMFSPFAAFALQTRSASHVSLPSEHDGVT